MIVAKVKCKCLKWVRIRTLPEPDSPNYEYGWVLCTHNGGCGRKLEIERKGGRGARIVGKCDGIVSMVVVDYQE